MNLGCSHFEVYQTPTYITELILSRNEDGEYDGGMKGVARRYVSWCRYERQHQYNTSTDKHKEYIDANWSQHIAKFLSSVQAAMKAGETVTFYCE